MRPPKAILAPLCLALAWFSPALAQRVDIGTGSGGGYGGYVRPGAVQTPTHGSQTGRGGDLYNRSRPTFPGPSQGTGAATPRANYSPPAASPSYGPRAATPNQSAPAASQPSPAQPTRRIVRRKRYVARPPSQASPAPAVASPEPVAEATPPTQPAPESPSDSTVGASSEEEALLESVAPTASEYEGPSEFAFTPLDEAEAEQLRHNLALTLLFRRPPSSVTKDLLIEACLEIVGCRNEVFREGAFTWEELKPTTAGGWRTTGKTIYDPVQFIQNMISMTRDAWGWNSGFPAFFPNAHEVYEADKADKDRAMKRDLADPGNEVIAGPGYHGKRRDVERQAWRAQWMRGAALQSASGWIGYGVASFFGADLDDRLAWAELTATAGDLAGARIGRRSTPAQNAVRPPAGLARPRDDFGKANAPAC